MGGTSYDAHQVVLWLDVEHEHLKTNFAQTIRSILAHELHHCAWAHARGGKFGETYGENLVLEGLACCFEEEIGGPTPFYALECKGADLERFSERARGQLSATRKSLGRSWDDWTFGRAPDDPDFPYQCGYSLGYAIVRNWLAKTGGSASSAVGVDARAVLEAWSDGWGDGIHPSLEPTDSDAQRPLTQDNFSPVASRRNLCSVLRQSIHPYWAASDAKFAYPRCVRIRCQLILCLHAARGVLARSANGSSDP